MIRTREIRSRMRGRALRAGLLLVLALAAPAHAIRIQFPDYRMSPDGIGARGRMYVTNNGPTVMAVEVDIASRRYDAEGKEVNEPVEGAFRVLPRQLILPPQSEKLVSIQWQGPRELTSERAYRVVIQEVPIELGPVAKIDPDRTNSTLKVVTRIRKSLYVTPDGARPEVVLRSAGAARDEGGRAWLELRLANRGTAHRLVDALELSLSTPGAAGEPARLRVGAADFGGRINLLAGSERRLRIAWPEGLPPGPIHVELESLD